jgi:outer membrane lipoprotein-sorting protein
MGVFYFGRRIGWILFFISVVVMLSGLSAHALLGGKITKYTADQVMIDANGKIQHKGKIYVTPNKMRMDSLSPKGEGSIVMIFRRDKNIGWTLNPEKKLYMERPFNEKDMEQATKRIINSKNEKVLGTETVNGFKCTKKEVETSVEFMGYKRTVKSIIWMSKRLDMPIRTKSQDGSMTELRNIKKGAPAGKYFEIPNGYKKVSNMMELMGMDMSERERKPSETADEDKESDSGLPFKLPKGIKGLFGN